MHLMLVHQGSRAAHQTASKQAARCSFATSLRQGHASPRAVQNLRHIVRVQAGWNYAPWQAAVGSAVDSENDIVVRALTESDIPDVASLQLQGFHKPLRFLPAPINQLRRNLFIVRFETVLYLRMRLRISSTNFAAVLVATSGSDPDAAVIGTIDVCAARRPDVMRCTASVTGMSAYIGHGHCEALVVSRKHRRRGCAQRLLRHAERLVADWGYAWISLQVEAMDEPARALYTKAGYIVLEFQPRRRLKPWKPDLELLGKSLQ